MKRLNLAIAISMTLLTACNDENMTSQSVNPTPTHVRVGAYNLSFDRATFDELVMQMQISAPEQEQLMQRWFDKTLTDKEIKLTEKIIQIRNVAAIIQSERPAVLMMSEFNNDGSAENQDALTGFRVNYLSVPQNALGTTSNKKLMLQPIQFDYAQNFATNTGLLSEFDLDKNGEITLPGDAWGFGFYHGQYAFALLSQYPIDTDNIRTFQHFKWQDMPGETNPTIIHCNDENNPIPAGMQCGDNWYSAKAWAEKPLSSKNHIDAPILIPTENGEKVIHLLLSHPTPPVFDTVTENNKRLNRAEIAFWNDYLANADYIYDDAGKKGGLNLDDSFIIMGDLNADPNNGDGFLDAIQGLIKNKRVNTLATEGIYTPSSLGAAECIALGDCADNTYPERITSTFGLRVDHVIPSNDLNIIDSGVFWPASFEQGHLLMNDKRVGQYGSGKDISSDHRLVWIEAKL